MAHIDMPVAAGCRKGFSHRKKHEIRIDMTPMVDLGFRLLAFFIFTAQLSKPAVTDLRMPGDKTVADPNELPESLALTFLPDENNRIFYYHGDFKKAVEQNGVKETSWSGVSGIGEIIRQKQMAIDNSGKFPGGRKGLMLLIKPTKNASYKNIIDALDEALINDVKKYAIVDPSEEEVSYLSKTGSIQGFNSSK